MKRAHFLKLGLKLKHIHVIPRSAQVLVSRVYRTHDSTQQTTRATFLARLKSPSQLYSGNSNRDVPFKHGKLELFVIKKDLTILEAHQEAPKAVPEKLQDVVLCILAIQRTLKKETVYHWNTNTKGRY